MTGMLRKLSDLATTDFQGGFEETGDQSSAVEHVIFLEKNMYIKAEIVCPVIC